MPPSQLASASSEARRGARAANSPIVSSIRNRASSIGLERGSRSTSAVERVDVRIADLLGGLDREGPGEDPEAGEEWRRAPIVEQVVAPVDRGAKGLLAGGGVARRRRPASSGPARGGRASATGLPSAAPAPRPARSRAGRPSRRAQISLTAVRVASSSAKPGFASLVSSTNSLDGGRLPPRGEEPAARARPSRRRQVRLVTSTRRPGAPPPSSSPIIGAAPSTCSKLSSTSSIWPARTGSRPSPRRGCARPRGEARGPPH